MSARRPPAVAIWLLDCMGFTARNPPLAGDLLEAFHQGRSHWWYWRQTLIVIANGCGRNLLSCRRFMLPLCAGFAAQTVVAFGLWRYRLPPTSAGWNILLGHVVLAIVIGKAMMKYAVIGRASISLPRLLARDDMQDHDRRVVNRMFAGETFFHYLAVYCVMNCFWRPSLTELVVVQAIWFATDVVSDVLPQTLFGQWPVSRE